MKVIVQKRQRRKLVEDEKRDLVFRVRGSIVEPEKIDRWMKRRGLAENQLYSPSSGAGKDAVDLCLPSNILY
jgi:hypothetical protein